MNIKLHYKTILVVLSLLIFTIQLHAQCVNFVLTTQEDVDDFPGNCSVVTGSIIIGVGLDITNLNALSNVTAVEGNLSISAQQIISLTGLENLTTVGGDFTMNGMHELETMNSLQNLEEVGGALGIYNNESLTSLQGLESLQTVGGGLGISDNDMLTSFTGLDNLNSVGYLRIEFNDKLQSLEGLGSLTEIGGIFIVSNNESLSGLEGIDNLQSVGTQGLSNSSNALVIEQNDVLPCLIGLESLNFVGGDFEINNNPNFLSLTGVENITSIGGDIVIEDNYYLNVCNLPNLCTLLGQASVVNISGNDPGCESLADIQSYCGIEVDCPTDLIIRTQAQIDKFSQIYPNCTEVSSNLVIDRSLGYSNNPSPISNLLGLSQLTKVEGDLIVDGNYMDEPFDNLQGLENLQYVAGEFRIFNIPTLISLSGLSALDSVGGTLRINSNISLTNFDGLSTLKRVGGNFLNYNNTALSSLTGLSQLKSIGGYVNFENNNNLINLEGLSNLDNIGGDLRITENELLESLVGFEGITSIEGTFITIDDNPSLSFCAVWPICSYLGNAANQFSFADNAAGCNTELEILSQCDNLFSKIEGKVYADLNCNNLQEAGEGGLRYHVIKNTDTGMPFTLTNGSGNFSQLIPPSATTTFNAVSVPGYSVVPVLNSVTTGTAPLIYSDQDFRMCPDLDFHNLAAALTAYNPPRPGFENKYQICIENTGTNIEDVNLTFNFSNNPSADYVSFVETDGAVINGNTLEWTVDNFGVFELLCFEISVILDPSTPLGTLLYPRAVIMSQNSIDESNSDDNLATFAQEVVGSFDPNDKTSSKDSISNYEAVDGAELEYLIRFQNTGTFPATFVEVLDTLDEFLDFQTFEMLAASHDYELTFSEDHVLKWRFDNINLPDSTSNEPESHGFIKFKIRTIPGLNTTQVVSNRAAIYFDFNAPVITNTALTSVYLATGTENSENPMAISVFPNPAKEKIFLNYHLKTTSDLVISVIDGRGVELLELRRSSLQAGEYSESLEMASFPQGLYFIRINAGEQTFIRRVVLKK